MKKNINIFEDHLYHIWMESLKRDGSLLTAKTEHSSVPFILLEVLVQTLTGYAAFTTPFFKCSNPNQHVIEKKSIKDGREGKDKMKV